MLFTNSCGSPINEQNYIKVEYWGALKNMMKKGDISWKVDLINFKDATNFYALGAVENLKGEIQIFDSNPHNTFVLGSKLIIDTTYSKGATLLVSASVDKWASIDIPTDISTYDELEKFVGDSAKRAQLNTKKPFPFLIEGVAESIDWHVINWKDGDKEHTHEKHINSGLNGTSSSSEVMMLGFYSNAHHAIFTHHTTNMHIHMKTKYNSMAGHVDDLVLGSEMILKLPDIK